MIGRALRIALGKKYALIIDCGASWVDPQVGDPLEDYPWTLLARGSMKMAEAPTIPCPGGSFRLPGTSSCGTENMGVPHDCGGCTLPLGQQCIRCQTHRYWKWWDWGPKEMAIMPNHCWPCEEELRGIALDSGDTLLIVQRHGMDQVHRALLTDQRRYYGNRYPEENRHRINELAVKRTRMALRQILQEAMGREPTFREEWNQLPDSEDVRLVKWVGEMVQEQARRWQEQRREEEWHQSIMGGSRPGRDGGA